MYTHLAGWGNYPWINTQTVAITKRADANTILALQSSIVARGMGRSYADQAINGNGITALATSLNKFINFDASTGLLECEAGVSLDDIITHLAPLGWFPNICPGTKYVSIGGAIANDVHGKAHHVAGSFISGVISFEILLANGNIVVASREQNSDLFYANFGGLGLLGIILSAKIQLVSIDNTYYKQKSIKTSNLDHLLDEIDQTQDDYDYSVAWIDSMANGKNLGKGVLTIGNKAKIEELPSQYKHNPLKVHEKAKFSLPIFLPEFVLNKFSVKILNAVIDYTQTNAQEFNHYEKFLFPLDSIGNWNKGYGKRGFIQYQFVIPEIGGRAHIKQILSTIANGNCMPFLNVLKKFGRGQDYLSFPFEGYTFAIDFPVTKHLPALVRQLDQMVINFGGRVYLGKDAMLTQSDFEKMYPEHAAWKVIKNKYDPTNKYRSSLGDRLGLH
jgi:decaprenylphospho-beta-D-ribofuranose 2-oxidase